MTKAEPTQSLITYRRRRSLLYLTVVLAVGALTFLVWQHSSLLVMGGLVLVAAVVAVFIRPEMATATILVVIYSNIAAVATQVHNVPEAAAGSVALLLGVPLVDQLVLKRKNLIIDPIFLLMCVLLVVMLISSLFARDVRLAGGQIGTFALEGLVLYLLVVNVIRTRETLRRAIWAVLLVGAFLGALSLYQVLTHSYGQEFGGLAQRNLKYEIDEGQPQSGEGAGAEIRVRLADRAQGPMGDPNRYAQILVVLIPLALSLFRGERSGWLRLGILALSGFILCGLLLSYSRGAFVTLIALLILMICFRSIRLRHVLVSGVLLLILIAAFAPGYFQRMGTIKGVSGLVSDDATAPQPDAVTRGRLTEMLAALLVFRDHPFLGVGPGQYLPFYSRTYQLDPDIALRQLNSSRRAHDMYVEIAAEIGLIGFGVFMTIFVLVLRRLWVARRYYARRHPELGDLATGFWLSIFGYLGTAVFLHLSYQRYLWLLVGLAGASLQIFQNEAQSSDEEEVVEPMEYVEEGILRRV